MTSGSVAAGGIAAWLGAWFPAAVGFGVGVGLPPFVGPGVGGPPWLSDGVAVGSGVTHGTTIDGSGVGDASGGGQGTRAEQTWVGLNLPPHVAPNGWKLRL